MADGSPQSAQPPEPPATEELGVRMTVKVAVIYYSAPVLPVQLNCGMAMFTLLDASSPGTGGNGLVRVSAAADYYFDPASGEPHPQRFVDEQSLAANRLFGQDTELLATSLSTRIRAGRRMLPGSYIAASKGPPMATAEPGNNSDPYIALVGHRPNSADPLRRFA
jgi:hypothetical protein